MDYRTELTPTAAADLATVYVALELSQQSWLAAVREGAAGKTSLYKVKARDTASLLGVIDRAVERAREKGCGQVRAVSCYEAGRDGFWLHRLLLAHGVENQVLDAASIAVPRQGRRAKTDRLDVHGLLRALLALARGEAACRMVRVPTPAEEDARRLGRERRRLVHERVGHVNRIKGLCALVGIGDYEPARANRRQRLAALQTAQGGELPVHLKREVERHLARLERVLVQLKEVEAERDAIAARAPPADSGASMIRALVRLKAVACETATTLVREVFYRPFDNRRQLGAYLGLDGSPWRSGGLAREQGISKAGNPRARAAAIELAWRWLRYQPDSALSRWFHRRVAGAKGATKRKMIVALARKLIVALWRYVRFGLVPEDAVFKPQLAQP
jgi:transposase